MSDTKYLVIFYGVSAGQNGDNLGSDEQDLVMLIFLVIDTEENKVRITDSLSNWVLPVSTKKHYLIKYSDLETF